MARVLLVYASTHGHTARIADRIARSLEGEGVEVDVRAVGDAGDASPRDHDGAIVGASLHEGRHQREIVEWVRHHRLPLDDCPNAFFSVSLTAADDTDEARAATQECIDDFLDDTGWTPNRSVAVAGALQYREYDPFSRLLMRLKMRQGGHPTDTSHDVDYTDWDAVDDFAREFAARLKEKP
jgi:menaquinone-dependent protoporphyrinogen oxidase